jgi:hypothetical protein
VKKIVLVPLLIAAIVGSAAALDWKSYPGVLEKGKFLVNAGIGLGDSLLGDEFELPDKAIPPIRASVDYALFAPFTVGAEAGFFVYKDEWSGLGMKVTNSGTGLAFAGRFGYHPDFGVKNLDVYATAGLGLYILSWKTETKYDETTYLGSAASGSNDANDSEFAFILTVGARYFFTKNIGVFADVGVGPLSVFTGGVALKF